MPLDLKDIDLSGIDLEDLIDLIPENDVTEALDKVKDIIEQNPAVKALLATAFAKLQNLIKDAGLPEKVTKPRTAAEIRAAAQGATANLKESQSSLEQFIEWGLSSSEELVGLIASLLGATD